MRERAGDSYSFTTPKLLQPVSEYQVKRLPTSRHYLMNNYNVLKHWMHELEKSLQVSCILMLLMKLKSVLLCLDFEAKMSVLHWMCFLCSLSPSVAQHEMSQSSARGNIYSKWLQINLQQADQVWVKQMRRLPSEETLSTALQPDPYMTKMFLSVKLTLFNAKVFVISVTFC